mmetsp:Transcript_17145/g.43122  ORF Transcript_17145/g.43122 Transcript_17145/m.43122 type:complete len:263 (-) Transcript_17145:3-791(-)
MPFAKARLLLTRLRLCNHCIDPVLHLQLMLLLGVDHLVEVQGQEGQNHRSDDHDDTVEHKQAVALEETSSQRRQRKQANAQNQTANEAGESAKVHLSDQALVQFLANRPVLLGLGQKLHHDHEHDDHLQALAEEDHKSRNRKVEVDLLCGLRTSNRLATSSAAVAALEPHHMAVDLGTLILGQTFVACLIFHVVAAPFANCGVRTSKQCLRQIAANLLPGPSSHNQQQEDRDDQAEAASKCHHRGPASSELERKVPTVRTRY